MPFIVQCPHTKCGRFMLLEDSARGARVACLVCKGAIEIDPSSGSGEHQQAPLPAPSPLPTPAPKPAPWAPSPTPAPTPSGFRAPAAAPPPVKRERIAACPKCNAPLRLPPHYRDQPIRCPRCSHVFTPLR
jgi:hypothetical protein